MPRQRTLQIALAIWLLANYGIVTLAHEFPNYDVSRQARPKNMSPSGGVHKAAEPTPLPGSKELSSSQAPATAAANVDQESPLVNLVAGILKLADTLLGPIVETPFVQGLLYALQRTAYTLLGATVDVALNAARAIEDVLVLIFPGRRPPPPGPQYNWANWGSGLLNDRFARLETKIGTGNAGSLVVKRGWPVRVFGDVSATPTVVNGTVYIVDWGFLNYAPDLFRIGPKFVGDGHLTAIESETGRFRWTRKVSDYTGFPSFSRTSPAIEGDILIIGTMIGGYVKYAIRPNSAYILAINATTGDLLWKTLVSEHPMAAVTVSPTIYNGGVYIGLSSFEEALQEPLCCTFQGSVQKLDLYTGKVLWTFVTAPPGYYGVAVWGSSPAIDVKRNSVYVATGNNYLVPDDVNECFERNIGNYTAQALCDDPANWINSVLSLDLDTGKLKWGLRLEAADIWVQSCSPSPVLFPYANCTGFGEIKDWDFGQAPMLIPGKNGRSDLLTIGQKSGFAWGIDPEQGKVKWATDTLGGTAEYGGMLFGSATDGERIYMSNANTANTTVEMINPPPGSPKVAKGGYAQALDLDGKILWQTANPIPGLVFQRFFRGIQPFWGLNHGPLSVANGIVYFPCQDLQGHLYFLDAKTGRILGSFKTGQPIGPTVSGPSIVDGTVYVGSGYAQELLPNLLSTVWALTVPY